MDLWSLGVILFELYTGQPPFYTNSIYTLIKQIVRETVQYPASMSADFRSFLQVRRVLICRRFPCLLCRLLRLKIHSQPITTAT